MLVISLQISHYSQTSSFKCGYSVIKPGIHVRNWGALMDTKFPMELLINKAMHIAFLKN